MRFEAGYLTVGSWDGAPIRIHWTTPLAALLFGAGRGTPAFWLGFCLVILVHQLGHGLMVHRVGGMVDSIDVAGWGGHCRWSCAATRLEDALVAAGGLLAQAIALAAVGAVFLILGRPQSPFALDLVQAFVRVSLILALLNAIPISPLDGARAWRLLPYVLEWLEEQRLRARLHGRTRRRTRPLTPPNCAKIVSLDEHLDRQLNRILSRSSRQTSETDESH